MAVHGASEREDNVNGSAGPTGGVRAGGGCSRIQPNQAQAYVPTDKGKVRGCSRIQPTRHRLMYPQTRARSEGEQWLWDAGEEAQGDIGAG